MIVKIVKIGTARPFWAAAGQHRRRDTSYCERQHCRRRRHYRPSRRRAAAAALATARRAASAEPAFCSGCRRTVISRGLSQPPRRGGHEAKEGEGKDARHGVRQRAVLLRVVLYGALLSG